MDYRLARDFEKQQLINSKAMPLKQTRIDCFSMRFYHLINDNEAIYFNAFNPSEFGIEKLSKERKNNMNALQAKLAAMNNDNAPAIKISSNDNAPAMTLKEKLAASTKQASALQQADLTINKFAEVEAMRQTLKDQGILIADLINGFKDLSKVVYESNTIAAIIGKDTKSALNAINTMAARQAGISPAPASNGNAPAIPAPEVRTRKGNAPASNTGASVLISNQISSNDEYQMVYDIFKSYFNHKFAKSGKADQLAEFMQYINAIDFSNADTINNTARASWQAYRAANNKMLYAPNSMTLAIDSMIKVGNDLELIAGSNELSESNDKTIVKDFAYWSELLKVKKDIIAECVSLLKLQSIEDPNTIELIRSHIAEASNGQAAMVDLAEFMTYLNNTNFAG